uniref:Uncharacterized protein n=1 Tax=Oryza brachyantha TaxID=4533 RepID=J3LH61_ORYBR
MASQTPTSPTWLPGGEIYPVDQKERGDW